MKFIWQGQQVVYVNSDLVYKLTQSVLTFEHMGTMVYWRYVGKWSESTIGTLNCRKSSKNYVPHTRNYSKQRLQLWATTLANIRKRLDQPHPNEISQISVLRLRCANEVTWRILTPSPAKSLSTVYGGRLDVVFHRDSWFGKHFFLWIAIVSDWHCWVLLRRFLLSLIHANAYQHWYMRLKYVRYSHACDSAN